jgi:hypothetical protein
MYAEEQDKAEYQDGHGRFPGRMDRARIVSKSPRSCAGASGKRARRESDALLGRWGCRILPVSFAAIGECRDGAWMTAVPADTRIRDMPGDATSRNIAVYLWLDGNAEEAANFHAGIFPDSHVDAVHRAPWTIRPAGRTMSSW